MSLSRTDDMCSGDRSQTNALQINNFAAFMHMKSRRESKEAYMEVEESKVGIGLQVSS